MEHKTLGLTLAVVFCSLTGLAGRASAAITMPMVTVGNPGNAPDPYDPNGVGNFGSVGYTYNIGKYDVTAGQYTAFLNSVAATSDPYGLYNPNMNPAVLQIGCGIVQTPISGGYHYSVDAQHQNYPVNYVSWGDAARFSNWLSNNQPTGNEGNGTTETGSYTLSGATSNSALMAIARNAGATYVIPTENEWYKAAYYKGGGANAGYWMYPTKSDAFPDNSLANAATDPNDANYFRGNYTDPTNYLTPVGTFAASPSAYGTFDQAGDVGQWNEASFSGSYRGLRGDSYAANYPGYLSSGWQSYNLPASEDSGTSFRVALVVPEPASLGILSFGVIGILVRRKRVRR